MPQRGAQRKENVMQGEDRRKCGTQEQSCRTQTFEKETGMLGHNNGEQMRRKNTNKLW
jgi:hypothetical protein